MRSLAAGLSLLSLLVAPSTAHAQKIRLGQVLVFGVPDLKADADTGAFERYVVGQVAPAWQTTAPGMELHLVRADRGSRKGYLLTWTTDTEERHKGYASSSGSSPFNQALRARMEPLRPGSAPFINTDGTYSEYHLLSPDKVGALPDVEILGIHYIKVRPDRREAFERFVADKLHPAVANLRPDLRLLYYKCVRGVEAGNYITVFALSRESRDKYWPKGSDSDDVRAAFKPVKALTPELSTYLVEGSYATGENMAAAIYESREWTDFVRVAPGR